MALFIAFTLPSFIPALLHLHKKRPDDAKDIQTDRSV